LIVDPMFYLVAIPAVLLNSISKGGFGGALGGTAVPLMAIAISPRQAAGIMLPLLCLTDVVGLRMYFGKWDKVNLKIIIPGALVGVVIGTLTFGALSESAIRLIIGAIAVLFVLHKWSGLAARQAVAGPSIVKGVILSAVSGFTSFVAHAGSPPLVMYLLPQRLDKTVFIATASVFFMLTNALKVVPYAWLGQFSSTNLLASLVLSPLVPIGVWAGMWLQQRVNQVWFYRITEIGLLLIGLNQIYQGLAA
jgi:uncharacterized membrane protein YfcA